MDDTRGSDAMGLTTERGVNGCGTSQVRGRQFGKASACTLPIALGMLVNNVIPFSQPISLVG
jgi:hypothetical protein